MHLALKAVCMTALLNAPLADVPGNVLQATVGAVVAIIVSVALGKTALGRSFYYKRTSL